MHCQVVSLADFRLVHKRHARKTSMTRFIRFWHVREMNVYYTGYEFLVAFVRNQLVLLGLLPLNLIT